MPNNRYTKQDVMKAINGLRSMSELKVEEYAEEGGMADSFVQEIGKELKPTQLRRVFHHIKDLQREMEIDETASFDRTRIAMLMPLLAYAVGRKLVPPDFYDLMKLIFGSQRCRTKSDFQNAAQFLEAIMAYHKYHFRSA